MGKYQITDIQIFSNIYLSILQTLSSHVALGLERFGGPDNKATIEYVNVWNKWFDVVNIRNPIEWQKSGNPNKKPFTCQDDERFIWLEKGCLQWFQDWADQVKDRPTPAFKKSFNAKERSRMFIAKPTWEGLYMTTNSKIELTRFLLASGAKYVLTE